VSVESTHIFTCSVEGFSPRTNFDVLSVVMTKSRQRKQGNGTHVVMARTSKVAPKQQVTRWRNDQDILRSYIYKLHGSRHTEHMLLRTFQAYLLVKSSSYLLKENSQYRN